jgi:hypothetical protein
MGEYSKFFWIMSNICTLSITPPLYALPPPTFWILWILAGPLGGSLYVFPTDSTTICESLPDIYLEFLNSFKLNFYTFQTEFFKLFRFWAGKLTFVQNVTLHPFLGFL